MTFTSIDEVRKEAWRRRTAGTGTWYQLYGGYKEPSVALPANVIVLSNVPDEDEILMALIACDGDITKSAEKLGVDEDAISGAVKSIESRDQKIIQNNC